jgi:hypothetical protein
MKALSFAALLVLSSAPLVAQTPAAAVPAAPAAPAAAPATQTHSSAIGFSYSIPADWQVVDTKPSLPAVQQQAVKDATTDEEKKGIACVEIPLTARHGTPASVIVAVALPFDCFGQTMTDKDLPGFAASASEGLKKSFELSEPVHGAYSLGTHSVWIERTSGSPIGHPEVKYTVETVCSVLKKGTVCWMAMTADADALETFEHGAVALDGEPPAALVPAEAFQKKP